MIDEAKQKTTKQSRKEDRRVCIKMKSLFWPAASPGSILSLDYREAFVATNSTHVRTCRNSLDLIPPRISQDMKQFEIESF